MSLTMSTRRHTEITVISVGGELDLETAPQLQQQISTLMDQGVRRIVIDLSGVTFCDSTGLSVFVRTRNTSDETGGDIRLASPQPGVRRILQISGLYDALGTYATVDEALAAPPAQATDAEALS
jgi:anti-sigma B factor antagonist